MNFKAEKPMQSAKSLRGLEKLIPVVFLKPLLFVLAITFLVGIASGFFQAAKKSVEPFTVTVAGNFGSPVTLQTQGDASTAGSSVKTLIKGTLPQVTAGDQLLYRAESFALDTETMKLGAGEVVTYAGTASETDLGKLAPVILGHEMGSRILVTSAQTGTNSIIEIIVIDILPNAIIGDALSTSGDYKFPTVNVADNGRPVLSGSAESVSETQTATVIQGEGLQVKADSKIIANYVLTDLEAQVLENTWDQPAPKNIDLTEVYPGLKNALVDQKVGSRIMAVIPAAQAQGDKDVIIVVDILQLLDTAE
ncbi:MAG: hypothetical protein SPG61_00265 [Arcanobacterium sp.]|nr:hypothetical protein [Arcanobacterium sp.]